VFPLYEMVAALDGTLHCACGASKCEHPGKHPRTAHGLLDGTTDEAQIRRWWTQHPNANIGLCTGDGILVLDVDDCKGGDDSLDMLERRYGKLPDTRQAVSGSGGRHLWFRLPEGVKLGNATEFEDGLDTRGDGGYVVVAPSNHVSGKGYFWDGVRGFDEPVAQIPAWFLNLLTSRHAREGAEEWRKINIKVNRHVELSPPWLEFIEGDSDLAMLWNLQRPKFVNEKTGMPNFSRYDMALAGQFIRLGATYQQTADAITAFRLRHGNPKGKGHRLDYLQRTIYRASHGEKQTGRRGA